MYAIDGPFGQVRHVTTPYGEDTYNVPFPLTSAGWHKCNDLYHIHREENVNSHLLIFARSDGGQIKIGDNASFFLPQNAVAWLPVNLKHDYRTKKGGLWEMYWLHLYDKPWIRLADIFRDSHWLQLSCMDTICDKFEVMLQGCNNSPAEFWIESSHIISDIYHLLMRESLVQHAHSTTGDPLVLQILRDMENACHLEWSLEDLSKRYFLSVPQLIRRFKAETGMTPHACLTQIRLRTAKMYLSYTMLSIEEIAGRMGFSGTSNFILQFRKKNGITPLHYRAKKQAATNKVPSGK